MAAISLESIWHTVFRNGAVFEALAFFAFMVLKPLFRLAFCAALFSGAPWCLNAQTTTDFPETEAPVLAATGISPEISPEDPFGAPPLLPQQKNIFTSTPDYKLRWKVDAPIIAAGTAWTLYGFGRVYDKDKSTLAQIQALRTEDVNGFDRWAAGKHSAEAAKTSDFLFYGSIPLPLILMGADKTIRKDFWKVGALYLETMAITGTLYTGATYLVDRYRPETYDFSTPAADRLSGNYKNAFFAGHVANVGAITFFTAKIFHDYHPTSPWRWAFWGGAGLATGTTALLRHEAGKHWPTDLLLGTLVGAGAGILVPQLHKKMHADGTGLRIAPYMGPGTGISLAYRF